MAFLQKIPENRFNAEGDFIVKESKTMRLIMGLFFIAFSIVIFQASMWIAAVTAIAGTATIIASRRNQVIMTINAKGFSYYGNLLTDWKNFVSAEFLDEAPSISSSSTGFSDKFSLYIKYRRNDKPGCFARKIPLTNTQDKSEEEILAAIRFYYRKSTIAH